MKRLSDLILIFILLAAMGLASGCEPNIVRIESVVHPDGSVDRTIVISEADSNQVRYNYFGINAEQGWTSNIERVPKEITVNGKLSQEDTNGFPPDTQWTNSIIFSRHFNSVEDINASMGSGSNDTLFGIRSTFEKRFRWFFTYYDYSDIYLAINRFEALSPDEVFNAEDYDFIDRLPAEGSPLSREDSSMLKVIEDVTTGHFAAKAIFFEYRNAMVKTMQNQGYPQSAIDSLVYISDQILRDSSSSDRIMESSFLLTLADSLGLILSPEVRDDYLAKVSEFSGRFDFMTEAKNSKFTHVIRMPWHVVETNADSVNADVLYWQPQTLKFMLKDYEMTARSRKLNAWAVIVSLLLISAVIWIIYRMKATWMHQ